MIQLLVEEIQEIQLKTGSSCRTLVLTYPSDNFLSRRMLSYHNEALDKDQRQSLDLFKQN